MADSSFDPKNLDKFKKEMKNILKNAEEVNQNFGNWEGEFIKIGKLAEAISEREAYILELKEKQKTANKEQAKELQAQIDYETEKQKIANGYLKTLRQQVSVIKTAKNQSLSWLSQQSSFLMGAKDMFYEIDSAARTTSMSLGLSSSRMAQFQDTVQGTAMHYTSLGLKAAEAVEAQASYSDEVGRTVMLSSQQLMNMASLGKKTGLATKEIGQMAGQMEAFGMGGSQAIKYIESIKDISQRMGVNSGKVIKKTQANLKLMNKLNFKGGAAGLAKMAAFSEKFKVDMETVAGSAEKMFSPEGAIEAAASLQMLGGGFSALADPFQLMFDARNDPEKYAQSITDSLQGVAQFKDGEFIVSAYEMQRLEQAGEALGFSKDQMVEMAKQKAKMDRIGGLLGGLDPEQREMMASLVTLNKQGRAEVVFEGETRALSSLSAEQKKLLLEQQKTSEQNAQDAMTTQELWKSIGQQILAAVKPIVEVIDEYLRPMMTTISTLIKEWPIATLITSLTAVIGAKMAIWYQKGVWLGMGFNSSTGKGGGFLDRIKGLFGRGSGGPSTQQTPNTNNTGQQGGIGNMLKGVKANDVIKGAAAVAILAGALWIFAKSLQEFDKLENGWDTFWIAAAGLGVLGGAAVILGKFAKDAIKGAVAVGILGLSLLPLAFAMEQIAALGAGGIAGALIGLALGLGILTAAVIVLGVLGETGIGEIGVILLLGIAGAALMLGAATWLVAAGMSMLVDSFTNLFSVVTWDSIAAFTMLGPALLGVSAGILALSISMVALGASMLLGGWLGLLALNDIAEEMNTAFSNIDANGIVAAMTAINSADMNKIESLKELSRLMSMWGMFGTKPIQVNMDLDGDIELSGDGGTSKTDWINDPIFVKKLKDLIMTEMEVQNKGGR
jgi:hypothetical protein